MMGHKICFYGEIWTIIPKLSVNTSYLENCPSIALLGFHNIKRHNSRISKNQKKKNLFIALVDDLHNLHIDLHIFSIIH